MSSSIVQPIAFNAAKLVISAPKLNKAGGKSLYIGYGESRNLVLQTPSLRTPFGVKNSTEGKYARPGPAKYTLDLELRGHEENPKVKALYEALKAADEHVFKLAEQNSKLWFGKQRSHDALLEAFVPSVKQDQPKDGGAPYPPRTKVSLKKKFDADGNMLDGDESQDFKCPIYDQASRSDPHAKPLEGVNIGELLAKNSEVTTLLEAAMIWVVSDRFGISWTAKQIRVDVPGQGGSNSAGYGFVDDEDAPPRSNTGGAAFQEPTEFSSAPASSRSNTGGAAFQGPTEFSSAPAPAPAPASAQRSMTSAPKAQAFEEDEDEAPAPAPASQRQFVEEDEDEIAPPQMPVPKKTVVTKKTVQTKLVTKAK